jgi:hypothetical protein
MNNSDIMTAIINNDIEIFKNISDFSLIKSHAFELACKKNRHEIVDIILNNSQQKLFRFHNEILPILVMKNYCQTIEVCINYFNKNKTLQINDTNIHNTLLIASVYGSFKVFKYFTNNIENFKKEYSVHLIKAFEQNHKDIVNYLWNSQDVLNETKLTNKKVFDEIIKEKNKINIEKF